MSLDGVYASDNVFARILRGEIPKAVIFEDEQTMAFMDAFPQSPGHALVIHKFSTARNLLDAEPEVLATLIVTVQKIARAARAALKPDGLVVTQFNGEAAGQTVYHLHFHIIPRWVGADLGRHGAGVADPVELRRLAALIASNIKK